MIPPLWHHLYEKPSDPIFREHILDIATLHNWHVERLNIERKRKK